MKINYGAMRNRPGRELIVKTSNLEILSGNDIHRLVRVTAVYRLILQRSFIRWQHPSNPGSSQLCRAWA
jgi:hypothetical protein